MSDLSDRNTLVIGASRGLGRGIAAAFAEAGAPVIAVARTASALGDLASGTGEIRPHVADAADATVPAVLIDRHQPGIVILVAGARPPLRPLHRQSWEEFSVAWNTMCASRSTGCARPCSSRCGPAAGSSWSAAARR